MPHPSGAAATTGAAARIASFASAVSTRIPPPFLQDVSESVRGLVALSCLHNKRLQAFPEVNYYPACFSTCLALSVLRTVVSARHGLGVLTAPMLVLSLWSRDDTQH